MKQPAVTLVKVQCTRAVISNNHASFVAVLDVSKEAAASSLTEIVFPLSH